MVTEELTKMRRLENKVAVVTGGARGIGAAFCEGLASQGAYVVVADVLDGSGVVKRITEAGGGATYCRTDVTAPSSIGAMVAAVEGRSGSIDILVNNAAIFADLTRKPFLEIDSEEWSRIMSVNVRGPFECAKAIAPIMMKKQHGKIINIASGSVFKGVPEMMHYVTSKGAVIAMTRCLARELGSYKICVNAIAPGLTMSEAVARNPQWTGSANTSNVESRALQRDQTPEDIIGALIYLASDESNFVTGQTIVVDGGSVMH